MGLRIDPERISWLLSKAYGLWCATLRYEVAGIEALDAALAGGRRVVVALWHDELFALTHVALGKGYRVGTVVSASRDGELLARTLERLGLATARGSSHRGGVRALVAARRLLREGRMVVVTVDGPRGPRHKAKPGAVALAQAEGGLIAPVRLAMAAAWRFSSWDRFQLPYPFSRVRVACGAPYEPTGDLDAEVARLEAMLGGAAAGGVQAGLEHRG